MEDPSRARPEPRLRFDLDPLADLDRDRGDPAARIPRDCAEAAAGGSSVGCWFFTVDLDNKVDAVPFAAVVANVHARGEVEVVVERRAGPGWAPVAGPVAVAPLSLHAFELDDFHHEGAGKRAGGAYRIRADRPIVAYQFNPVDAAHSRLSDASLLYPVASWDDRHHVVQWAAYLSGSRAYVTVAAAFDGTTLAVTPSVATRAGPSLPAAAAGETLVIPLGAGDTVSIVPAEHTASLTGTLVLSDPERPVALFSGHACANIPGEVCCCDHLEEQLSGLRLWGRELVVAHMPVRLASEPEPTLVQLYAAEDGTVVTLDHAPGLVGVPAGVLELDAGELVELFVTAPAGIEADLRVHANHPIAALAYMVGADNLAVRQLVDAGDPAMVQVVPVEQFLPRYVVLVPSGWRRDVLVLTRAAGAEVRIDGLAVADAEFVPVGAGEWEVARIVVADGVHVLDSGPGYGPGVGRGFGVEVVGWDQYDSYAYAGGAGTARLAPER